MLGALAGSACWNHLLSLLEHFEGQLRKSFSFEQTEQTKQRQGEGFSVQLSIPYVHLVSIRCFPAGC